VLLSAYGGVFVKLDTRKNDALEILREKLKIVPKEIHRFTTGYCHNVYHIKCEDKDYVLRITSEANKAYYFGSIRWLSELSRLEIPVPKILAHGQHNHIYFVLMTYICGKDLGEVYHTLDDFQKCGIAKDLCKVQKKVSLLPSINQYGYHGNLFGTWSKYLESLIERSRRRMAQNEVFDTSLCNNVSSVMHAFADYFLNIKPLPFLDDITTKNVLIHDGKLAGIVDIDEICHGDSLLTIGLTNMSLLSMNADTRYIDFWLDELCATPVQRKAVDFYTLLFCIDFMGEQGMRFDNDKVISINQKTIASLKYIYHDLQGSF